MFNQPNIAMLMQMLQQQQGQQNSMTPASMQQMGQNMAPQMPQPQQHSAMGPQMQMPNPQQQMMQGQPGQAQANQGMFGSLAGAMKNMNQVNGQPQGLQTPGNGTAPPQGMMDYLKMLYQGGQGGQ